MTKNRTNRKPKSERDNRPIVASLLAFCKSAPRVRTTPEEYVTFRQFVDFGFKPKIPAEPGRADSRNQSKGNEP